MLELMSMVLYSICIFTGVRIDQRGVIYNQSVLTGVGIDYLKFDHCGVIINQVMYCLVLEYRSIK